MDGNSVHRALFDGAPIGLAVWDGEVRYRAINARLAEINGIAAADHIGRTPSELLGELGVDAEAALRRVLETREAVAEIDFAGETPAEPGVRRHWLGSFFPVPGGVGGVVVDVTERRLAAEREHAALEAAETAKARAETLAQVSTALGSSIHASRVLAGLVDAVVPSLADFCAVHLARPRRRRSDRGRRRRPRAGGGRPRARRAPGRRPRARRAGRGRPHRRGRGQPVHHRG